MNRKQAVYVLVMVAFGWILLSLCYWMYYRGSFSLVQVFLGVGLAFAVGGGIVGAIFAFFELFVKGYEKLGEKRKEND